MYNETPQQTAALVRLEKLGFEFDNWISAGDDENPDAGAMVCTKRKGPTTHYREIAPDGTVN